ncbi:MAG: 5-oxoprolinase subunit PxpB [Porticoccus sp.]
MNISVAGENSLMIYFGEESSPVVSARVQHAVHLLEESFGSVLIDMVPSYASLLVIYDLFRTDIHTIRPQIREVLAGLDQLEVQSGNFQESALVELPVYYSHESGPDLQALADRADLSVDDVIQLHQAQEYRVYAIGFAPGFAYLGQVDERIAAPRLATPRQKVPRGAVGIADRQTAIYPAASPGGWNLIGLCPQPMFDPNVDPSMPVQVGDRVRFKGIDRQSFLELGGVL